MKVAIFSLEDNDIDIWSQRIALDLEYTNDDVLLSKDTSKLHIFLDRLNGSVGIFEYAVAVLD